MFCRYNILCFLQIFLTSNTVLKESLVAYLPDNAIMPKVHYGGEQMGKIQEKWSEIDH